MRCASDTWPVSTTNGMESHNASVRAVTALVARRGPDVTSIAADLAGRARVKLGGMDRALLVTHQHGLNPALRLKQRS